jgi:REP-associated tyrosine transposase
MKTKTTIKALSHSVYNLNYHLVIVTKYRRKVITKEMLTDLKDIFSNVCAAWRCELVEFNGEADHAHLLISAHPNLMLSDLVNNLKTASSRRIRRIYKAHVRQFYWKPVFWHRSYCLISAGGAPLSVLKQYIEQQNYGA